MFRFAGWMDSDEYYFPDLAYKVKPDLFGPRDYDLQTERDR